MRRQPLQPEATETMKDHELNVGRAFMPAGDLSRSPHGKSAKLIYELLAQAGPLPEAKLDRAE
jgi:hypothetical protein